MSGEDSRQGHQLGLQLFPSPWNDNEDAMEFESECRCLVDLNTKFIVLLPDNRLFTLETERKRLPSDAQPWNKEQCVEKLREVLAIYDDADISKVVFPFFDKLSHAKTRPVVTLFSTHNDHARFNVALYMGAPQLDNQWLLHFPNTEFAPTQAPAHTVDISKVCTVPTWLEKAAQYSYSVFNLQNTRHDLQLATQLGVDPARVRNLIVEKMVNLAIACNPIIHYFDFTRSLDMGTPVKQAVVRDGEMCWEFTTFA